MITATVTVTVKRSVKVRVKQRRKKVERCRPPFLGVLVQSPYPFLRPGTRRGGGVRDTGPPTTTARKPTSKWPMFEGTDNVTLCRRRRGRVVC